MQPIVVNIPDELTEFLQERVAAGRFPSEGDYLVDLLVEAHNLAADERLKALLLEGLASGEAEEVTPAFWQQLRQELDETANEDALGEKRHAA